MTHTPSLSQQFIDTADSIAVAVEGGADPAAPSVVALLTSVQRQFGVTIQSGDAGNNLLNARPNAQGLSYTNGLNGNDFIHGSAGTDVIVGGNGNDFLLGLAGDDALFGGAGNDALDGGLGNDLLRGGDGNDALYGAAGNDRLLGGAGNDHVSGGGGADTLQGDAGNDALNGGAGRDRLLGGANNDILTGGSDRDVFVFDPSNRQEGADRITDFRLGEDQVELALAAILRSSPNIANADGRPGFSAADLDADNRWDLFAARDGDLVVRHPGGTIEFDGVRFSADLTFAGLAGAGAIHVV